MKWSLITTIYNQQNLVTRRMQILTLVASVTTLLIWMLGWSFFATPDLIKTPQCERTV